MDISNPLISCLWKRLVSFYRLRKNAQIYLIEKYNHTASSVTQFRDKNLYPSHFPAYWHLLFLPFIVHSSSHHLTAMKVSKRLVYIGLLLNKKVWFLPMISIINQWWKNLRNHGKNAKQKCQWNLSIRNNLWSNHEKKS